MNPRSLALVVLKCFAIYLLVAGFGGLVNAMQSRGLSGGPVGLSEPRQLFLWQAVPAFLYLGLGLLFLFNTASVVRWFFRELEEPTDLPSTPFVYQSIGFSVLGAWLLATSIPGFVSRAVLVLYLARAPMRSELVQWWASNWVDCAYVLAQIAVGLALFARSQRLASFWFAIQPPRESEDGQERPAD